MAVDGFQNFHEFVDVRFLSVVVTVCQVEVVVGLLTPGTSEAGLAIFCLLEILVEQLRSYITVARVESGDRTIVLDHGGGAHVGTRASSQGVEGIDWSLSRGRVGGRGEEFQRGLRLAQVELGGCGVGAELDARGRRGELLAMRDGVKCFKGFSGYEVEEGQVLEARHQHLGLALPEEFRRGVWVVFRVLSVGGGV